MFIHFFYIRCIKYVIFILFPYFALWVLVNVFYSASSLTCFICSSDQCMTQDHASFAKAMKLDPFSLDSFPFMTSSSLNSRFLTSTWLFTSVESPMMIHLVWYCPQHSLTPLFVIDSQIAKLIMFEWSLFRPDLSYKWIRYDCL